MTLRTERIRTLGQVRALLEGSEAAEVEPADRTSAYAFVRRTLVRVEYHGLRKSECAAGPGPTLWTLPSLAAVCPLTCSGVNGCPALCCNRASSFLYAIRFSYLQQDSCRDPFSEPLGLVRLAHIRTRVLHGKLEPSACGVSTLGTKFAATYCSLWRSATAPPVA